MLKGPDPGLKAICVKSFKVFASQASLFQQLQSAIDENCKAVPQYRMQDCLCVCNIAYEGVFMIFISHPRCHFTSVLEYWIRNPAVAHRDNLWHPSSAKWEK